MINPSVVEGQIAGGAVQGIGGALFEDFVYDDRGQPTHETFMDYLLPTATDVPEIEYGHVETPASTPGGYKGVGEGGAIGAPAAVRTRSTTPWHSSAPRLRPHRSHRDASSRPWRPSGIDAPTRATRHSSLPRTAQTNILRADDSGIGLLERRARDAADTGASRKPTMQSTRLADSRASGSVGRRRARERSRFAAACTVISIAWLSRCVARFVDTADEGAQSLLVFLRDLLREPPRYVLERLPTVLGYGSDEAHVAAVAAARSARRRRRPGTPASPAGPMDIARRWSPPAVHAGAGAGTRRSPRRGSPSNRSGRGPPSCFRYRWRRRSVASTHRPRRDRRSVVLRRARSLLWWTSPRGASLHLTRIGLCSQVT